MRAICATALGLGATVRALAASVLLASCAMTPPLSDTAAPIDAGLDAGAALSGEEPIPAGGCRVGTSRACNCAADSAGVETCLTPQGRYSACGCYRDGGPDVLRVPMPTPVPACATPCGAFTEEDTQVGAKACCTSTNACGAKAGFLFGAACVARGGPVGTSNAACPSESPVFLDLPGCCRPDGFCGLTVDALPNWDTGCIERTAMMKLVNEGSFERDITALFTGLPIKKVSFEPLRCTP